MTFATRADSLFHALRQFDDKWYAKLAGTAIGSRQMGHVEAADDWDKFCREWRSLIDGQKDLQTRVEDAACRIVDECSHRESLPEPCPVCLAEIALFGTSDGDHPEAVGE